VVLPSGSFVLQMSIGLQARFPAGTLTPFVSPRCTFATSRGRFGPEFRTTLGGALQSHGSVQLIGTIELASPDFVSVLCSADGLGATSLGAVVVSTEPSLGIATQVGGISGP
jgi:hypothetical protein